RNSQAGRATKWKALAYKGRVQMYRGDYAGALTTLREVRDSNGGRFALETSFDHVWTGFSQFANGKETILAYEASINDGEPNGNNSNYGERLNFPYVDPFCCGFHQPSQHLVNFFAVNDSGLPLAVTSAAWNTLDTSFSANTTVPVDPRLDWTAGRDGVPYKDWGLQDRKSTRLNSSHSQISYAVFCLKKKKKNAIGYCLVAWKIEDYSFGFISVAVM